MKKMNLNPGELICDECNGEIFIGDEKNSKICPKCLGDGKLDWVEHIVGKMSTNIWGQKTLNKSCLGRVNVRRMIDYITKTINNSLIAQYTLELLDNITLDSIVRSTDDFLGTFKNRRMIYDYKVRHSRIPDKEEYKMEVDIKPNNTTEIIKIDFTIR